MILLCAPGEPEPSMDSLPGGAYAVQYRLGDGAFSEVMLAVHKPSGTQVALKRVFLKDAADGRFPVMPFRELQAHRSLLGCPHVVPILDHFVEGGCLVLVQPAYPTDLGCLLDAVVGVGRYPPAPSHHPQHDDGAASKRAGPVEKRAVLRLDAVRSLTRDVLSGLEGMHACGVMHRDVKPGNVMVDGEGRAVVGDLGLARPFARDGEREGTPLDGVHYTAQVTSRWYRAPEILLGGRAYGPPVDMWAVGAVLVELLTGTPLAPGGADIEQLSRVFAVRGTPDEASWPAVSFLPDWGKVLFQPCPAARWEDVVPPPLGGCEHVWELLGGLLALDPSARLTAGQAKRAVWLQEGGCGCVPCGAVPAFDGPLPSLVASIAEARALKAATRAVSTARAQRDEAPW